jgi:hypothetical protein
MFLSLGLSSLLVNSIPVNPAKAQSQQPAIYELKYNFCAEVWKSTGDQNKCFTNTESLYFWGQDGKPNEPFFQAVLYRTTPPLGIQPDVPYKVYIWSQGCFPQHNTASELAYYPASGEYFIKKKFASNRKLIMVPELTVTKVTDTAKLKKIASAPSILVPGYDICSKSDSKLLQTKVNPQ